MRFEGLNLEASAGDALTPILAGRRVSRIRYALDMYARSIRFLLFLRNSDTWADTYRIGEHGVYGPAQQGNTAYQRIAGHPSRGSASHRTAFPHASRRTPRHPPFGTSARRPPATGDEPPLTGDEHPSLLAGAEDRPCSPVEFLRPCDVDPAPLVGKSPSPFSISSSS
jgi:hypothetical protein